MAREDQTVTRVGKLPLPKLKELVKLAKLFPPILRVAQSVCIAQKPQDPPQRYLSPLPLQTHRVKTGERQRWSYYCPVDQNH